MRYKQNGAALIVGLIILMVLSLLGITSMNNSILEEKMSGNLRNQDLSFQTAESGLSRAINRATGITSGGTEVTLMDGEHTLGSGASSATYCVTGQLNGGNGVMPRGSGYSAIRFSATHGRVRSAGRTQTGACTALKQGFFQVGPKR